MFYSIRVLFAAAVVSLFVSCAVFSEESATFKILFQDKLKTTEGIAVCPDGRMFTVENASGKVYEIIDDSTIKLFFEGLVKPAGMACGPDNTLYAAEFAPGNVVAISPDGKKSEKAGAGFKQPNGLAVASDGTVYVSETESGKVSIIHPDGKQDVLINKITYANGLLLSPDESLLYVNATTENKTYVTPLKGENRGKKKTFAKNLTMADGITADKDGNFYVCLYSKGEIAKVDSLGNSEIIAKGLISPATPVVKDGALYITSLSGKGIYKLLLPVKGKEEQK